MFSNNIFQQFSCKISPELESFLIVLIKKVRRRLRVGVIVTGEKCDVEQLLVFFFLLSSSTDRTRQAPRGHVGSSTISREELAARISVIRISFFQLWFFFVRSLTHKKEPHLTFLNTEWQVKEGGGILALSRIHLKLI